MPATLCRVHGCEMQRANFPLSVRPHWWCPACGILWVDFDGDYTACKYGEHLEEFKRVLAQAQRALKFTHRRAARNE